MMTVRFPDGVAVTYNDATYMRYGNHAHELYTKNPTEGGKWVASIPVATACIVETCRPCRVEQAALTVEGAAKYLALNSGELRRLEGWVARDLKRALEQFNARTLTWS